MELSALKKHDSALTGSASSAGTRQAHHDAWRVDGHAELCLVHGASIATGGQMPSLFLAARSPGVCLIWAKSSEPSSPRAGPRV
jgi:hypothetical protein